ncbi:MAG: MBOAT family O-acyltransferase [Bacillota bacterium]|nr:MBOAT family O-acyltransferase [Bacillota bacterium]
MAFTSFNFLVFALITVTLYYIMPKNWRWFILLAASYAFYLISSPKTFVFILFTTVVTFFGGRALGNRNREHKEFMAAHKAELSKEEKKQAKADNQKKKRKIVLITLVCDFGVLAALKYFRVYLEALGFAAFDLGTVLIPLGISFYTFQSAAYIIDLYRNKIEPDTNIAKFALFTSFFPQIIQGPISRYDQLAHQLYEGHSFSYKNLTHGAQLMLFGFFKKLVIADRVAILVTEVFDNHGDYTGGAVFVALLFYTIQIYADFSGGIDIARGVAQCMGIDMTHNFNRPYFSVSLSDFWRRWHMSLSFWCRDYIFYPVAMSKFFGKLGKNLRSVLGDRVGKLFPVIIAQFATFLTIGLWHGAEFKYIAYGLYNGTVIVLGLLLEPYLEGAVKKLHINVESKGWKVFQMLRTFFIVVFGRIFPKAASFSVAITMFFSMFKLNYGTPFMETIMSLGLNQRDFIMLAVSIAAWFIISVIEERRGSFRDFLDEKPLVIRWAVLLMGLAMVMVLGVYGPGYDASAFIYRGF